MEHFQTDGDTGGLAEYGEKKNEMLHPVGDVEGGPVATSLWGGGGTRVDYQSLSSL